MSRRASDSRDEVDDAGDGIDDQSVDAAEVGSVFPELDHVCLAGHVASSNKMRWHGLDPHRDMSRELRQGVAQQQMRQLITSTCPPDPRCTRR